MPQPNAITPAQLDRLIGTPDSPALVDVCIEPDFAADRFLIPGAFRHPHGDIPGLIDRLSGRRAVIICQKGKKLSQGVAARLRADGIQAEYLEGGMYGWRDHPGAMRVPGAEIPEPVQDATLWVTRHRPKIDRIACPWLIRRFVDPFARFLFVAPSEVMGVAERFAATPFDVAGVALSHENGRCTFDAMLATFALRSPALDRLATVIRGADTNRHELDPASAGLLAISVGLSRMMKDDQEQLEARLAIYDALYRWARDGQDEAHQSDLKT